MKWIEAENQIFLKDEVIAMRFIKADEQNGARLFINLRGGANIEVSHDDADRIWEMFRKDLKPKTALGF